MQSSWENRAAHVKRLIAERRIDAVVWNQFSFDEIYDLEYTFISKQLEAMGFGNCPICVAKTQYSLTDDPKKLGAPKDFDITVRGVKISAGAGFVVALTGDIMTMPGLPKVPAAMKIDVDEDGKITGLF